MDNPDHQPHLYEALTGREKAILERLSAGLSDQQIAAELFLSSNTVRWYNRQIYSKLGVSSRTRAIARAKDLGILGNANGASSAVSHPSSPSVRSNLPTPNSPLVGRGGEITEVQRLLQTTRLLTLTGVGGTGKTRLALHVAADVTDSFADGVCFVDLAPVHDSALVEKAIADALDVFENPRESLHDSLKRALCVREMLLLIDNFEHVMAAAPLVAHVLADGDVELGIRLVSAIWLFWFAYGYHVEGLRWVHILLPRLSEVPEHWHIRFLISAGGMTMAGDADAAIPLFLRALNLSRYLGDKTSTAWALAHLASAESEKTEALTTAEEALSLFRALEHLPGVAYALNVIGEIARRAGDDAHARQAYEECLAVCHQTGETRRVAIICFNLAFIAQHEGDYTAALESTRQGMTIARAMYNRGETAWCLPLLAGSLAALGQPTQAARLLGTSEAILERLGKFILPADQQEFDRIQAEVCAQLGDTAFHAALAEGRKMSLDEAIASVL